MKEKIQRWQTLQDYTLKQGITHISVKLLVPHGNIKLSLRLLGHCYPGFHRL